MIHSRPPFLPRTDRLGTCQSASSCARRIRRAPNSKYCATLTYRIDFTWTGAYNVTPDGALSFTEPAESKVGRMTTDGAVIEYELVYLPS